MKFVKFDIEVCGRRCAVLSSLTRDNDTGGAPPHCVTICCFTAADFEVQMMIFFATVRCEGFCWFGSVTGAWRSFPRFRLPPLTYGLRDSAPPPVRTI